MKLKYIGNNFFTYMASNFNITCTILQCWRSQSDLTADDTPDATSPEKNFPQGATLEGDGSSSPATSPVLLVSAGTTHIIRQPISSQ